MKEILLVVMMGFSPGSASEVGFKLQEYTQVNMMSCELQARRLNTTKTGSFRMISFCVERERIMLSNQ